MVVTVLEMRPGPFLGADWSEHGMHPCRGGRGSRLTEKAVYIDAERRRDGDQTRVAQRRQSRRERRILELVRRGPVVVEKRLEPFALLLGKEAFRLRPPGRDLGRPDEMLDHLLSRH